QLALEKNPKLKDGDGVILWATSGTIWEEALIFRGKRCFDTLCIWHRKDEHTYLEPVGLNGALKWLQDTHMLDCRGLVQIKTWSPVANACFFDLVRYRNLENMQ
ncbi:MAG: hypothetical protein JWM16_6452, partial [Verrucomicrobiales bacterium]|nr:hypothetical protein [Verrucomicrobiales bacterium]